MSVSHRRIPPPPPPAASSALRPSGSGRAATVDVLPSSRPRSLARAVLALVVVTVFGGVGTWAWANSGRGGGTSVAEAAGASDEVACGAAVPRPAMRKAYAKAPKMLLEQGVDYQAIIHTSCGDMKLDLFEEVAPKTVNNFVFLAEEGFYDGLIWHQVVANSIIQTGDANGLNARQPDGPGYVIEDELPADASVYTYGAVGMANIGKPNTAGSQFFIVAHDLEGALKGKAQPLGIEPRYTVFGEVKQRFFGSIENIARQPVRGGEDAILAVMPSVPVYVERIDVVEK